MGRMRAAVSVLASMLVLGALTAASASASGPVWAYCGKTVPKNTGAYTDKACSIESPSHEGKWELIDGIGKGKGVQGQVDRRRNPPRRDDRPRRIQPGMQQGVDLRTPGRPEQSRRRPHQHVQVRVQHLGDRTPALLHHIALRRTRLDQPGQRRSRHQAHERSRTRNRADHRSPDRLRPRSANSAGAARRSAPGARSARSPRNPRSPSPRSVFFEEGNPRFDMESNPPAFEGEEGIHILRSEINDPENGFEWSHRRRQRRLPSRGSSTSRAKR